MDYGIELALKYQGYTLENLLEKFHITIRYFEGSQAEKLILGYIENDTIYVNTSLTKKAHAIFSIDVERLVICHELFHYLEKIHVSKTAYDVETNAHLFVQQFLNLDFNPIIIQTILSQI